MKVHILFVCVLVLLTKSSSQQDAGSESNNLTDNTASTSKPVTGPPPTENPQGTSKVTTKQNVDNSSKPASVTTVKPNNDTSDSGTTNKPVSNETTVTAAQTSEKNENKTTVAPLTTVKSHNGTDIPITTVKKENVTSPPVTTAKKETVTDAPVTTAKKENVTDAPVTTGKKENVTDAPVTTAKKENVTDAPVTTGKKENVTDAPVTTGKKENMTDAPVTTAKKENVTDAPVTTGKKENVTDAPVTTAKKENVTDAPVTTAKKENVTDAPVTTAKKENVTDAPVTTAKKENVTSTPVTTVKKENVTDAAETSKKVTPVTTQTTPVSEGFIYINEILVDRTGVFQKIELHLSKQFNISNYAMVIVDGDTKSYMAVINLNDMSQQQNNFLTFDFTQTKLSPILKDKGTGIAVYHTTKITMSDSWSSNVSGLMDALVIGKDYDEISNDLTQALTPGVNPFVLDPNKYGQSRAISRCSLDEMRSADMFALINPSFGVDNTDKCEERLTKYKKMSIKIQGVDCKLLNDIEQSVSSEQLTVHKVLRFVTNGVNKQCLCGVTLMHVDKTDTKVTCCDGASIEMRFVASSEEHLQQLTYSYNMFLKNKHTVTIGNKDYTLDSQCEGRCCNAHDIGPQKTTDDDKAGQIKVTVAVIISCLVVFSMIVVVVIVYMRKKNRAVYQFRMSRLDEEDDLYNDGPDHDDFIGGQEATFDIKRR